jgi:hypothetical protein
MGAVGQPREAIEMADDDTLSKSLVTTINVGSSDISGDVLDARPEDSLFKASDEDRMTAAMSARGTSRGSVVTKEILAPRRWGIGLDTGHRTLTATTQQGIRRALHPMEWLYKTRQKHTCITHR